MLMKHQKFTLVYFFILLYFYLYLYPKVATVLINIIQDKFCTRFGHCRQDIVVAPSLQVPGIHMQPWTVPERVYPSGP